MISSVPDLWTLLIILQIINLLACTFNFFRNSSHRPWAHEEVQSKVEENSSFLKKIATFHLFAFWFYFKRKSLRWPLLCSENRSPRTTPHSTRLLQTLTRQAHTFDWWHHRYPSFITWPFRGNYKSADERGPLMRSPPSLRSHLYLSSNLIYTPEPRRQIKISKGKYATTL